MIVFDRTRKLSTISTWCNYDLLPPAGEVSPKSGGMVRVQMGGNGIRDCRCKINLSGRRMFKTVEGN